MYLICEGLGREHIIMQSSGPISSDYVFNVLVEKPEVPTSQLRQHSLLTKTSMCRAQDHVCVGSEQTGKLRQHSLSAQTSL